MVSDRLPALLVVVVGLALVVGSVAFVYTDLRPDYTLSVEPADSVPDDEPVLAYADLPADAREVFDAARANGGTYTVHESPTYEDTFERFDPTYVRADGTAYRVFARSQGLAGWSLLYAGPGALLGLALVVVGLVWRRRVVSPAA